MIFMRGKFDPYFIQKHLEIICGKVSIGSIQGLHIEYPQSTHILHIQTYSGADTRAPRIKSYTFCGDVPHMFVRSVCASVRLRAAVLGGSYN